MAPGCVKSGHEIARGNTRRRHQTPSAPGAYRARLGWPIVGRVGPVVSHMGHLDGGRRRRRQQPTSHPAPCKGGAWPPHTAPPIGTPAVRPVYGSRYTECSVLFRFGVQFDGNMCLVACCNVDCLEAISITGGMSLLLPPCSPPLHGKLLIGHIVT